MHDYDCSAVIISTNFLKKDISFHVNKYLDGWFEAVGPKKGW